jgi:hypothetical protein
VQSSSLTPDLALAQRYRGNTGQLDPHQHRTLAVAPARLMRPVGDDTLNDDLADLNILDCPR